MKNQEPTGGCYDISSPRKGVIHISGCAVDPNETEKHVSIHVYIDGQMHQPPYVANKHDDVSQSYNGFDEEIILSSDTTQSHNIKVFALDTWGGNNPLIGEANVTVQADTPPTGQVEITAGKNGMVHVRGWARDPDEPDKSLEVHVFFGGSKNDSGTPHAVISSTDTHKTWADIQSADPGATWSKASVNGSYWFDLDVPAQNVTGTKAVYVYPINEPSRGNNPEIGHATVTIEKDNQPTGELESVVAGDDCITVKGWAIDPDEPNTPLNLHIFVGGRSNNPNAEKITTVMADTYNASLNRWEFERKIYVASRGPKTVYAYVINTPSGVNNPLIGSFPVVIGQDNSGGVVQEGFDRVLPDGDYMIVTAGAADKRNFYYLDINGADRPAADGTNVILTGAVSYDTALADTWTINYAGGFYTIRQKGTDMCLDVYAASTSVGANVDVYTSNDTPAQRWAITSTGNGYRVISKASCMSLDIEGGQVGNGKNVLQQSGSDSTLTQSWLFIPWKPAQTLDDGRYTILSEVDNAYGFYVPGGSGVEENQTVQIWEAMSLDSQYNSFDVTKLDNGYYKIIHAASGKALEVYGGGSTIGTQDSVTLHEWNGTNPQQWAIVQNGYNGGYMLWNRSSGYPIDLRRRETGNGKPLRQFPWNPQTTNGSYGSSAMTWRFVPVGTVDWDSAFTLPASLDRIDAEAFAGIAASVVRIPQGCTAIGSGAFKSCANLSAVYIPASVTTIADDAFEGCSGLLQIYGKSGSEAIAFAQRKGLLYGTY